MSLAREYWRMSAVEGAKVWLIGGTSESAELSRALASRQIPFIVTVTTEAAKALYSAQTHVVVGKLTLTQMEVFLRQHQIACVLDASHPFAKIVSEGAIAAVRRHEEERIKAQKFEEASAIAYLRYERKNLSASTVSDRAIDSVSDSASDGEVSIDTSLEAILNNSQLHNQRVLFTLGYRSLLSHATQISQLRQSAQLFARILPSQAAISAAISVGFSSKEIVALRPPVSYDLEKALWQHWKISLVVAKASGHAGGEAIKRQLAAELGIQLRLLKRPSVAYPHQSDCVADIVQFCERQVLRHRRVDKSSIF